MRKTEEQSVLDVEESHDRERDLETERFGDLEIFKEILISSILNHKRNLSLVLQEIQAQIEITFAYSCLMKHKLESRLLGEISITTDTQMIPPLWQKVKN